MSLFRVLIFILFAGSITFAQQIYFCKSVSPDGRPVEANTNWQIKSGTPITIFLDYKKPVNSSMVYMFIDRMVGGNFEAYDSKAIPSGKETGRVLYAYPFSESGNYSVYFINNSGVRMALANVTVKITEKPAEEKPAPENQAYRSPFSTNIVFCEKVTGNKPVNVKKSVSIKNGASITVFIKSDEAFNTNMLIVHIYKRKSNTLEDLLQTKKFKTQANWSNTYFKYKFDSPGEYKFSVYDEFENLMKSESILVTQ